MNWTYYLTAGVAMTFGLLAGYFLANIGKQDQLEAAYRQGVDKGVKLERGQHLARIVRRVG